MKRILFCLILLILAHSIYAQTCMDGIKNQDETDIDCGGVYCGKCLSGKFCITSSDCKSSMCNGFPGICLEPSYCNNGVKDGTEEGVDCGGSCDDNCQTCSDNIKNQDETDIDCGGSCSKCANGKKCSTNSDCQSSYCDPSKTCATPTCTDGIKNQDETDIDCGGAYCSPCGQTMPSCSDGINNQDETDIDCGGAYCNPCVQASWTVKKAQNDPGNHTWSSSNTLSNTMMQLKITTNGTITLANMLLKASGTGNDKEDISSVFMVADDKSRNGVYDEGEEIIGEGNYESDNGELKIRFSSEPRITAEKTAKYYIIGYNMKSTATGTFTLKILEIKAKDLLEKDLNKELSSDIAFENTKTVITTTVHTCDNGIKDYDEKGIDCGGAYCNPCEEETTSISDSELLRYIDQWAKGELDPNPETNNKKILEIIELWKQTQEGNI